MEEDIIRVKRSGNTFSEIILGRVEDHLSRLVSGRRVIVITDSHVYEYYRTVIDTYEHIVIGLGETIKTLDTVASIYSQLLSIGADRQCYIVGFGGGIVTDIAGFVASTYMRGLRFGFVATTLLAQVDASVGGKNGVNVDGYKNMAGTFNQPDFVICDLQTLHTLPDREFQAGLAEILKAGLICNPKLFRMMETYSYEDFRNDERLLATIVRESILIKAHIVERDERESGERKKLNLGHTFAHAIEKSTRAYLHGEAVALGLLYTARISCRLGLLESSDVELLEGALSRLKLPTSCSVSTPTLLRALHIDKKKEADSVYFIVLTSLGSCEIRKMKFSELETLAE